MKREISRLVVDIQPAQHKRLKAIALISGKNMHDLVGQYIDEHFEKFKDGESICAMSSHIPNDALVRSLDGSDGERTVECEDLADFFKKLGI